MTGSAAQPADPPDPLGVRRLVDRLEAEHVDVEALVDGESSDQPVDGAAATPAPGRVEPPD